MSRVLIFAFLSATACKPLVCKDIKLGTPASELSLNLGGGPEPIPAYIRSHTLAGDCAPLNAMSMSAAKGDANGVFSVAAADPQTSCSSKVQGDSYGCAVEVTEGLVSCVFQYCSD